MSYAVVLTPAAKHDLDQLPKAIQDSVLQKLVELGASPSLVRTGPARPPYPAGQLYRSDFAAAGIDCFLDAVFKYGQDEQILYVMRIYLEYD
jgi:hypothetical protein